MKNILILLITISMPIYAGVYQCQSNDSETVILNEYQNPESQIQHTNKKPQLSEEYLNSKNHKNNRIPFLIYYAIDSSEPFMKASVSFEVAKLQEKCRNDKNVNFAAILNSLYLKKNEIIICQHTILKRLDLSQFQELDQSLKLKRKHLSTGDHSSRDPGIMRYWVRYREVTNEAFGNFPLAHPDFLYDLINLLVTENSLFPASQYMPFLSLKSHGSKHTVLSGLYNCQIKSKTLNQQNTIDKLLNKDEILKLAELDITNNENLKPDEFEDILTKLKLDSKIGNGASEENSLGDTNLGGSSHTNGLGADDGLGSQYPFGLYHIVLNNLLDDLFNSKNKRVLGFMLLESCDSNRESFFKKEKNAMILGVYSAQYSLWYRNINWWEIFSNANNSTKKLMQIIEARTQKIINIKKTL